MRFWLLVGALVVGAVLAVGLGAPSHAAARDYDCSDFGTQAEAEEYLLPGDPYNLDADGDGVACEDNPCPCSTEAGGGGAPSGGGGDGGSGGHTATPPPPPPPYHLPRAAAERTARKFTRKFIRASARVARGSVEGCRRLGERRVDCLATTVGATAAAETTCRLRIAVRGRNRRPVARLDSVNCHTEEERLTAARALAAMKPAGAELAGHRVPIEALQRFSALAFRGYVEWTRGTRSEREECSALLVAKLVAGQVGVEPLETSCEPALL
jgi:hypothetical protein